MTKEKQVASAVRWWHLGVVWILCSVGAFFHEYTKLTEKGLLSGGEGPPGERPTRKIIRQGYEILEACGVGEVIASFVWIVFFAGGGILIIKRTSAWCNIMAFWGAFGLVVLTFENNFGNPAFMLCAVALVVALTTKFVARKSMLIDWYEYEGLVQYYRALKGILFGHDYGDDDEEDE